MGYDRKIKCVKKITIGGQHGMETKEKVQKTLNGIQSAVLLLLIVAAVAVCIRFKVGGPMIGLFFQLAHHLSVLYWTKD